MRLIMTASAFLTATPALPAAGPGSSGPEDVTYWDIEGGFNRNFEVHDMQTRNEFMHSSSRDAQSRAALRARAGSSQAAQSRVPPGHPVAERAMASSRVECHEDREESNQEDVEAHASTLAGPRPPGADQDADAQGGDCEDVTSKLDAPDPPGVAPLDSAPGQERNQAGASLKAAEAQRRALQDPSLRVGGWTRQHCKGISCSGPDTGAVALSGHGPGRRPSGRPMARRRHAGAVARRQPARPRLQTRHEPARGERPSEQWYCRTASQPP